MNAQRAIEYGKSLWDYDCQCPEPSETCISQRHINAFRTGAGATHSKDDRIAITKKQVFSMTYY